MCIRETEASVKLFWRKSRPAETEPEALDENALASDSAMAVAVEESTDEVEDARRTDRAIERTKRSWFGRLTDVFRGGNVDEALWESLEEILIGADTGVQVTMDLLDRVRATKPRTAEDVRLALRDELVRILEAPSGTPKGRLWGAAPDANVDPPEPPALVLVVGVNGTGKTTAIGRLAYLYQQQGAKVVAAAGDTYRAAAIEQLQAWGKRLGVDVIAHQQGGDAAAVAFDAIDAARARGAELVLIDTAGRLHNKQNLMDELSKVRRVIERGLGRAPDEVLLVLDATTGQNGMAQARAFTESVEVTSVMLTKLDGTAKGGIVFAIAAELGLPVRFIGTGQEPGDIAPFEAASFVDALLAAPAAAGA
jgi:fused signal recognition particle receptor